MSKARSSKQADVSGLKVLLTTGALAATLGGWAALALGPAAPAEPAAPSAVLLPVNQSLPDGGAVSGAAPTLRVVTVPADTLGPRSPAARAQSSR